MSTIMKDDSASSDPRRVEVRRAARGDVLAVARLHQQELNEGFLSSLGPGFLRAMYRAIVDSNRAVLLVAREGSVLTGFAAAALDSGGFWREFARRHAVRVAPLVAFRAVRPSVMSGILEVVRHLEAHDGAAAELLSLVVGPPARRTPLSLHLVMRLEEEVRHGGAHKLTVPVRLDDTRERKMFERLGFHPLGRVEVHAGTASLRYERVL